MIKSGKHNLCSPINIVFSLCIFRENTHIVEDAETHREILLGMVTWWSETV